jgi:hypothetical protein
MWKDANGRFVSSCFDWDPPTGYPIQTKLMEVDETFPYPRYTWNPFPSLFLVNISVHVSVRRTQYLEKYESQSDDKHFYPMRLCSKFASFIYIFRAGYTNILTQSQNRDYDTLGHIGVCTLIFQMR